MSVRFSSVYVWGGGRGDSGNAHTHTHCTRSTSSTVIRSCGPLRCILVLAVVGENREPGSRRVTTLKTSAHWLPSSPTCTVYVCKPVSGA